VGAIGRAGVPLRIIGAVAIVFGILAVLGTLFIPHNMTCTSDGDCRTANDVLFVIAMLGRYLGAPFASAGAFAIGLSLLTAAFRPTPAGAFDDDDPRREASMTSTTPAPATARALAPARALWTYAAILFGICAVAAVFVSLPLSQIAFGSTCDENGCSYPPIYTVMQIAGFLAPSIMIAALLIGVLAIVATTINRNGGIRIGDDRSDRATDRPDSDPDAELDELLGAATDDLDHTRSRGAATWRGGDLTPFMRPPANDGRDTRD
jgi:hypothetical protein